MDAVVRVFKRLNGISDAGADGKTPASSGPPVCSVRLLVASSQAVSLIGKQGASIKSIQESSGATIRIITPGKCFTHIYSAISFSQFVCR